MQDLIDQAHGVDLPGLVRGRAWQPVVVQLLGECLHRLDIYQDGIAAERINCLIERSAVSDSTGDMEFVGRRYFKKFP